jgi:RimJ/RimL family protein N-acetyltransferase
MIPELESDRLFYKPLSLEHCSEKYVKWLNNPEVYKFLETGGNYTLEMLRSYLLDVVAKPNILFWGIHLKHNKEHIGNIKIDPVNNRHSFGEYGILIGEQSEWGKGYAKEASETIIHYCFGTLNLRKINLGVVEKNTTALQLYKSMGFEVEGVYKKHGFYDTEYLDIIRMAIFNPNFFDVIK